MNWRKKATGAKQAEPNEVPYWSANRVASQPRLLPWDERKRKDAEDAAFYRDWAARMRGER